MEKNLTGLFSIRRLKNSDALPELRALLQLGIPLMLSGLIESSPRFFNTFFLAALTRHEFAAGAISNWFFGTLMCILWGIFTAISILVAHASSEKNKSNVIVILRDGFLLAIILGIFAIVLIRHAAPMLIWLGQDPMIIKPAAIYLNALSWSIIPNFFTLVLLQFLLGLGHTRVNLFFSIFWVPFTILANYTLVLGKFGFHAYGIAGMGWGTTIAYSLATIGMLIYVCFHLNYKVYLKEFWLVKSLVLGELFRIGLPVGLMFSVETAFFFGFNLLMGHQSINSLTANQITLQYLGVFIAVIFSFSQAMSVRIGYKLGESKNNDILTIIYVGIAVTLFIAIIIALLTWIFHLQLIKFDIDVSSAKYYGVVNEAQQFLKLCALFQLCETIRLILLASLRGLKDTSFALLISIISYFIVALPLGYLLATRFALSGIGLWWGVILGSICGTVFLILRLRHKIIVSQDQISNIFSLHTT